MLLADLYCQLFSNFPQYATVHTSTTVIFCPGSDWTKCTCSPRATTSASAAFASQALASSWLRSSELMLNEPTNNEPCLVAFAHIPDMAAHNCHSAQPVSIPSSSTRDTCGKDAAEQHPQPQTTQSSPASLNGDYGIRLPVYLSFRWGRNNQWSVEHEGRSGSIATPGQRINLRGLPRIFSTGHDVAQTNYTDGWKRTRHIQILTLFSLYCPEFCNVCTDLYGLDIVCMVGTFAPISIQQVLLQETCGIRSSGLQLTCNRTAIGDNHRLSVD